jgi:hypothetical protein
LRLPEHTYIYLKSKLPVANCMHLYYRHQPLRVKIEASEAEEEQPDSDSLIEVPADSPNLSFYRKKYSYFND